MAHNVANTYSTKHYSTSDPRSGSWTEATRKSITLQEDQVDAFTIFVYWMHRNQLPFSSDPTITIITAVEFSVLADKLLLPPKLRIQALDCGKIICAQRVAEVPAQVVGRVLKVTALDCPLRRFILDIACYHYFFTKGEKGKGEQSHWLKDFLSDCNISEVVEIFDMFKDSFVDSGRLKSLKRHHWTAFNAIDGTVTGGCPTLSNRILEAINAG